MYRKGFGKVEAPAMNVRSIRSGIPALKKYKIAKFRQNLAANVPFHWVAGLFSRIPAVCVGYNGHGWPVVGVARWQLELTRQLDC
jgi:hypothetical protein